MTEFTVTDCAHMARALHLAERGRYSAHPNPVVGCVIAKGDDVLGEGWHVKAGEGHAEVNALEAAGEASDGATAYVTLEPCSHQGRTAPCADALIKAGVSRVVAAMQDPNPQVAGQGLERLREAGIAVDVGLMASVAGSLNPGFIKRVSDGQPFVRLKLAASIDGAIAMSSGESQWITGAAARADVQRLRARSGAVLTGIGTVLADDPSLNVRACEINTRNLQPLRVVLDSDLRMPLAAGMLALPGETLVCCCRGDSAEALQKAGAEVQAFSDADGRVDVEEVLAELGRRQVNEVLVEAGPQLAGYLLQKKLVDELVIYRAPHIMGSQTLGLAETPNWNRLIDRAELNIVDERYVGSDLRITARIND